MPRFQWFLFFVFLSSILLSNCWFQHQPPAPSRGWIWRDGLWNGWSGTSGTQYGREVRIGVKLPWRVEPRAARRRHFLASCAELSPAPACPQPPQHGSTACQRSAAFQGVLLSSFIHGHHCRDSSSPSPLEIKVRLPLRLAVLHPSFIFVKFSNNKIIFNW